MKQREIKFRAWDKKDNDMVYIDDLYWFEENGVTDFSGVGRYGEYIFMQFTGLHDKNGKDVYEGDVCKFNRVEEECSFFCGIAYIDTDVVGGQWEIVSYLDPLDKGYLDPTLFWNEDFEIIGNIHEKPELIEVNNG